MNLKYVEESSIAEHLNQIQKIVTQLATMKMTLDGELQTLLFFSSLPDSWKTLIVFLSNLAPDGVVTMDIITFALLNEEVRRKSSDMSSFDALIAEKQGRSMDQNPGMHDSSRGRSKSKDRGNCHHCGKSGHIKKYCYALKKELREKKKAEKK